LEVVMADAPSTAAACALEAAALAAAHGRDDLSLRLTAAASRASRPATVVCVVGEFKQGKSSLVNALLGATVCPVDDDMATSALTLLRYGDQPKVLVRRKDGDDPVVEEVAPSDLRTLVTEAGNPDNERQIERVDVSLPHPLLAEGLVLVDSPGMGGMGAGHSANTLAFLPFADGLVFASDASAELSAPEVDFLKRARDLCPTVLVAITKTDLYPHWRRIEEIDQGHLARVGVEASSVGLSAPVRAAAQRTDDDDLDERSGFPTLRRLLATDVIAPAKSVAAARAVQEVTNALDQLERPISTELEVLADPTIRTATVEALERARDRLEHLRGPGARWSTIVGDRVADLNNDVNHRFRGVMRQITSNFDHAIERLKSPEDWDELGRRLQTEVAESVTDVFQAIERGAAAISDEVLEVLGAEAGELPALTSRGHGVDVVALWRHRGIGEKGSRAGRGFTSAVSGLRGAQGGVMMFGMMGRFLPAGAAAVLMSNPVTLGLGLAFGGLQLLEAHKRKLAQRRQAARTNIRHFLDDVQFEVTNGLGEALRDVQRTLRDELGDRVAELQRTYAEAARQAQEAAQIDAAGAAQRTTELQGSLRTIQAIRARVAMSAQP
jgi:hypothetical protein